MCVGVSFCQAPIFMIRQSPAHIPDEKAKQHMDNTRATCTDLTWLSFLCFLLVSVQSARQHPGSCAMYKSVRTRGSASQGLRNSGASVPGETIKTSNMRVFCATKTKSILRNDNFAYHLLPSNKLAGQRITTIKTSAFELQKPRLCTNRGTSTA